MEKSISAADANRKFSQLLREVREGRSYVVTSHGRQVARIEPVEKEHDAHCRTKSVTSRRTRKTDPSI
jgi:prevent-host-death family protein